MEQWLTELFEGYGPHILFFLTILVLIICGIGVPIPEEITFIAAGLGCHAAHANQWILCMCGVAGILLGDTIPYFAGRRYGMDFLTHPHFAGVLSYKHLERIRLFFEKHGSKTVFCARFVAGLRMPTFFMAGSMCMRYRNFILWDLLGALLSCPTTILLAYYLGEKAKDRLNENKIYVFCTLGIIMAAAVFFHWLKNRNNKSEYTGTE